MSSEVDWNEDDGASEPVGESVSPSAECMSSGSASECDERKEKEFQ